MPTIYEQHDTAFKNIAAYVVTDLAGNRIATIAFKAGNAVTCYLHIIGLQMTKGRANGGGYDRKSAAAFDAIQKTKILDGANPEMLKLVPIFKRALERGSDGAGWENALHSEGFRVLAAV